MRKIIPVLAFIFAAGIAFPQQKRIVLQNVNIVDVEKGVIVQKQNVVITGDRISSISARYQQQTGDSIVEAGGQYLIPGLWDMHTHVWTADYYFTLFIANGITGHRGLLENIFQAREWREQGKVKGPMVPAGFYAGPVVDGPKPTWPNSVAVSSPEQGRKAVDSLKNKLKVDFIKVYSGLSKESYYAIAEEAKKQGIVFAGHVPGSMKLMECIQA